MRVRLRRETSADEWVWGQIIMMSSNAESVAVLLAGGGMVRCAGGYCGGVIPLTIDYEERTVKALWGDGYEIEIQGGLDLGRQADNPPRPQAERDA